jgi:glycolate oxidase FAD binding subunit
VDVWGPPAPAFELMQNLKDRLDPDRRFNPGRFVGGL